MEIILSIATLLGGVSAVWYFVDKFKEQKDRRRAVSAECASEKSAPLSGRNASAATISSTSSPKEIPDEMSGKMFVLEGLVVPESVLPIETVLETIKSKKGTSLQKAQFVQRHSGRHVVWTVELKNIQHSYAHNPESDLIMVIAPVADKELYPPLATAFFPASEGSILGTLNPRDIIVIEGDLFFNELAGNWSVSMKNAKFIRGISRQFRSSDISSDQFREVLEEVPGT